MKNRSEWVGMYQAIADLPFRDDREYRLFQQPKSDHVCNT